MAVITTADVDAAYDAALGCQAPLEALRAAAQELKDYVGDRGGEDLPEAPLAELAKGLRALRGAVDVATRELNPVREMLHLASLGRVDVQLNEAGSCLEAFVAYMAEKVAHADRVVAGQIQPGTDFHNLQNLGNWPLGRLRAEFDIERARVKARVRKETGVQFGEEAGLWRFEGGRPVLQGKLAQLKKRSRTLMQYFIQRKDRLVTYRDLGIDVWESEYYRAGTIQEAVRKLRADLEGLELVDVKERLRTEEGGYLFG